jgi:hypothetical protein
VTARIDADAVAAEGLELLALGDTWAGADALGGEHAQD